jgi:uncharacterized protein DUF6387
VPVVIDLRFPNRVLKKHFGQHLQRLRRGPRGKPEEAGRKSPDLKEWARIGVLPCMDLLLWAEEEEGSITDRFIADALEKDLYDDHVRKTIRPLAMALLEPGWRPTQKQRLWALAYEQWAQRQ